MNIQITNKGDPNAADGVSFRLDKDHLIMSLHTYESFALLSRDEAGEIAKVLIRYAATGQLP